MASSSSLLTPSKDSKSRPGKAISDEVAAKKNKAAWVHTVTKRKCKQVSTEFNEGIKKYVAPNVTFAVWEKNDAKNRYCDVRCIDSTRVKLKGRDSDKDYIHASWVRVPTGANYICAQGPMKETIEDFWQMIVQEKTSIVLMLCDFYENSEREKCAIYFPAKLKEKITFGEFTITNMKEIDEVKQEGLTISLLEIKHKGGTATVKHVYMRSWMDNLAPVDAAPVLELWRWVKKRSEGRPVVVHCSAGVGRTSTFVGFELANFLIGKNAETSLLDVVKELRSQRYQSIQSHVQFLYIHILLIEHFQQEGIIPKDGPEKAFVDEYRKHAKKRMEKSKNKMADKKEDD